MRLKDNFHHLIVSIKCFFRQNKNLLLISGVFVVLGILLTLNGISDAIKECQRLSILGEIRNKTFNVFIFEIKIIIIPLALLIGAYFLSANFYLFFGSYILILLVSKYVFRWIILMIACDAIYGIMTLFLIILPCVVVLWFGFMVFFVKTLEIIANTPCRKKISFFPYNLNFRYIKPLIKNYIIRTFLPIFLYTNLIILIFYLIFSL